MISLFNEIFYRPIFNALIFIYNSVSFGDLGAAIVLLTIFIRIVLFPLFHKTMKHQTEMQRLGPEIKKIQDQHKDNREKQAQALLEFYRRNKINPLSGFFLLIPQILVFIALYSVFMKGISETTLKNLYSFVAAPSEVSHAFLGLIDLNNPNILIVGLAAVAQFFQGRMSLPKAPSKNSGGEPSLGESIGRQMVYIGPIMTIVILMYLPAAVGLYWLTTSLISVGQQAFINKSLKNGKS
ncbi:MAG: membrane protein insertase YidC [Parcubacteria group bacterium]|nr:membrane protein insertase YidC [Parcubacteria group bacterium]